MERRNFIKNLLPLATVPLVTNKLFASVLNPDAFTAQTKSLIMADIDRVLVLVRMDGGNDGLNTVIPLDQYNILSQESVRKSIIIPENKILKLQNNTLQGFHPSMKEMQEMYNSNELCIVQGVGNPDAVFSHFHSMDMWESNSTKTNFYSSGWMGRYLEATYKDAPNSYPNLCMMDPLAIEIANNASLVTRGTGRNMSYLANNKFNGKFEDLGEYYNDGNITTNMKNELTFIRNQQSNNIAYSNQIVKAYEKGRNTLTYPSSAIPSDFPGQQATTLSAQLRLVARLLAGGIKTKVFVVSIGNFDNHLNQGGETGWHSLLLKDLSGAIGAFQKDINALGLSQKVLGMTYSEFGRRVASNPTGTEHGYAAPLFLFGSAVKGGVIGKNINFTNINQINPGTSVPAEFDYRQVYKSVLSDWFGLCSITANSILKRDVDALSLFKQEFVSLPCVSQPILDPKSSGCTVSIVEIDGDLHNLYARIFPNPSSGSFTIEPTSGFNLSKETEVKIYDLKGVVQYAEKVKFDSQTGISINQTFSDGMYIVTLKNDKYSINQKILISNN
jgi:uncharacterized protein (DUF1501 family)